MLKLSMTAVVLSLGLSGAYAQDTVAVPCAPLDEVMDRISEGWGEEPLIAGISSNGHILQILSNPRTGSWTALVTNPVTGQTCIVDDGNEIMIAAGRPNV